MSGIDKNMTWAENKEMEIDREADGWIRKITKTDIEWMGHFTQSH